MSGIVDRFLRELAKGKTEITTDMIVEAERQYFEATNVTYQEKYYEQEYNRYLAGIAQMSAKNNAYAVYLQRLSEERQLSGLSPYGSIFCSGRCPFCGR